MNFKIITTILLGCIVLITTFYVGYLYGNRQRVNNEPAQVDVVASNLARRNSLSDIKVLDIWGAVTTQKRTGFGQLYYKVSSNQTEILVRMQNLPVVVEGNNSKINLPNSLLIKTAIRTPDGLNYKYDLIGEIFLDEPTNGVRGGEFSTILDYSILGINTSVERIVFHSPDPNIQNLFLDEDPNLPTQARKEPAPFFWVIV